MRFAMLSLFIVTAACSAAPDRSTSKAGAPGTGAIEPAGNLPATAEERTPNAAPSAPSLRAKPAAAPLAEKRTLAEWRKAENRNRCAPLALTDNGGIAADVRPALFAGGWAVAFDQSQTRSLYGVAGTGVAVNDFEAEKTPVRRQWPYGRLLGGKAGALPEGAVAGYGIEGAASYPDGNPDGEGANSLAYVLIPGQGCLYNVWSRLGRRHLETLLDGLTLLPTD